MTNNFLGDEFFKQSDQRPITAGNVSNQYSKMSWQSPTHNISGEEDIAYKENPLRNALNRIHNTRPVSKNKTTTLGDSEDSSSQIVF